MIAEELATTVSGVSVDEWFNLWLPNDEDLDVAPECLPTAFAQSKFHFNDFVFADNAPGRINHEDQLYPKLCEVIQNVFDLASHRTEGKFRFLIRDTAQWPERNAAKGRPDGSVYMESDKQSFQLTEDDFKSTNSSKSLNDVRKSYMARTNFSKCCVPLEIKYRASTDGFRVSTGKVEDLHLPNGAGSVETRGQLFEYCLKILRRQHRQFLFAIHIYRNMATLIATDRVSAPATTPFDYVKEPLKLLTFFYRLAKSEPSALGYDPTVTPTTQDEIQILKSFLLPKSVSEFPRTNANLIHDAFGDALRLEHKDLSLWPIHKVVVASEEEGQPAAIAFDLEKHDFVFLKDGWRPDSESIHAEWKVYERLKKRGLTKADFVATIRCGGDAPNIVGSGAQRTRSQKLLEGLTLARIHCRLVLNEIAHPLSRYQTALELISVLQCALFAHKKAWTVAGVLHGDISDNNIMIVFQGRRLSGILLDWDLCKYGKDLLRFKARNGKRSGTWPFLSALRLQYPKKPRELSDDIESFIHVIVWHALCYHKHDLSYGPEDLASFIQQRFHDIKQDADGIHYGCLHKLKAFQDGIPDFTLSDEPLFNALIKELYKLAQRHYNAIDYDDHSKYKPTVNFVMDQKTEERDEMEIPSDVSEGVTVPAPSRVLDSHDGLLNVLTKYIAKPTWPRTVKLPSQFAGLPDVNYTHGEKVVIYTSSEQASSSKRPREEAEADTTKLTPVQNKKPRTTTSGDSSRLASVEEEIEINGEERGR